MGIPQFTHSPVEGNLSCFQSVAIMNTNAVKFGHRFSVNMISFLLGKIIRRGLLDHNGKYVSTL